MLKRGWLWRSSKQNVLSWVNWPLWPHWWDVLQLSVEPENTADDYGHQTLLCSCISPVLIPFISKAFYIFETLSFT